MTSDVTPGMGSVETPGTAVSIFSTSAEASFSPSAALIGGESGS